MLTNIVIAFKKCYLIRIVQGMPVVFLLMFWGKLQKLKALINIVSIFIIATQEKNQSIHKLRI